MKKYKLVIFDMDGTILDTIEDIKDAVNVALEYFGYPVRTVSEVKRAVGNGLRKTLERSLPAPVDEETFGQIYSYMIEHYSFHSADKTKPYDGIVEVIRKIKDMGYDTAVISNKKESAVKDLCEKFYKGLFDYSLGEKEGRRPKPYPDAVNYVLEEMKIESKEAIYIGDSEVDIETAKNSNMDSIIVTWGFREEEFLISKGAKTFARYPSELLEILQ